MNIQIDPHTLERAEERGATKEEIIDVIKMGFPYKPNAEEQERQKYFLIIKFGDESFMSKNVLRSSTLLN